MLLPAVDDATGKVVSALFCEYENTRDYFVLMRGLIERHGVPIALYTDRHSVFKHVPGSGLPSAPTQFSRAMDELGIQMIYALSPQAKGRVERAAGTFQDRLVTELRLAGATTIEDAGVVLRDFLPHFNERFGASAPESEVAYRFTITFSGLNYIPHLNLLTHIVPNIGSLQKKYKLTLALKGA